jgi:FSR family fosmidomycin resistance protein-like MFS transporter
MLMGLPMGLAGLIYVGVGALQEAIGLAPAMATAFAIVIPAAVLALVVLRRTPAAVESAQRTDKPPW